MPWGLKRYHGEGSLHFITWSCYQRQPFLGTSERRNLFLTVLEKMRQRYRFVWVGYVVMHEHVHLLVSEPQIANPSTVVQAVKLGFARRVLNLNNVSCDARQHVWLSRFYDFNLWRSATDFTFGFDTALHTVSDALDKIHTTAASHHRVMVVEVMGRDCGWIALAGGIAGGAHIILIPEIPFNMKKICDFIAQRESRGSRFTIIAVAEGIKLPSELKQMARGNPVGNTIGDAIGLFANKEVRVRISSEMSRTTSCPFSWVL
jgi:REP element-mobilizing transposase RayT